MAFIRQKGKYFSVVESYREEGKVKQRTLGYLGKTLSLDADLKFIRGRIKAHSKSPVVQLQTLEMFWEIVTRNQKALERRIELRKTVTLSTELERKILKQERDAKKILVVANRALLKLMKAGAR